MYRRPYYRARSAKYSNETIAFNTQVTQELDGGVPFPTTEMPSIQNPSAAPTDVPGLVVLPAAGVQGNRKVKNFTIKVTANRNDDQIFGALVYVPEGTSAQNLLVTGPTQSMYEPNQNVITTFIIPPNCERDAEGVVTQISAPTQITVSSRLARNLSMGDYLVLVFSTPNGLTATENAPVVISGTINYAIKF